MVSSLGLRLVGTERIIGVTGTVATVPLVEAISVGVGQMEFPPCRQGYWIWDRYASEFKGSLGSTPLQGVVSRPISQKDACICCSKRGEWTCYSILWVDPINEIEITQRFIPQSNPHQDNLSSHLHRLQHPASYLVRNDNLPNARPSS